MNNAVYGKTMENVDKRVDIKLLTHWEDLNHKKGANTFIAKPNFKNISIFHENLVAIQMQRLRVVYNKPIYIGFSVLELSKTLMYDFYYNFLQTTYQDRINLCYMDTDSFILKIFSEDLYCDIKNNLDKFDTSNFGEDNAYNMPLANKAVLGLFKDENAGKVQSVFIGLRSKMYCNDVEGSLTKKLKASQKVLLKMRLLLKIMKNV